MAADVARHIAATREEGYHVLQPEDHGGDRGVPRPRPRPRARDPRQRARAALPAAGRARDRARRWASRRWCAGATHRRATCRAETVVGIAERTGLIGTLTFWVLNAALRQAAQWRAEGIAPRARRSTCRSRMLTDRELPAVVDQSIKTWNVAPADVMLEITESSMIVDAERSVAMLTRLKGVGVQLSIDDFGSGFTSLAHLRRLPGRRAQDRPAVRAPACSPSAGDMAVVRSAIDIGHNFGLRVLAEGVEDEPTRAELARLGCDLAQGHASAPRWPPTRCATGGTRTEGALSTDATRAMARGIKPSHEKRLLHHHGGAVLLVARRQRAADRGDRDAACCSKARRGSRRCSSSSSPSRTWCSPSSSAPSPIRCRRAA